MRKFWVSVPIAVLIASSVGNAQTSGSLIPALERMAELNNPEAIYHIGMAYHVGAGLPKDPAKALEAFRRAASLGDPLASYKLGCFYDGQGGDLVKADAELALKYKLRAAEAGYALAQQDVAALFAGKGQMDIALAWLEKAAAQGWKDAIVTYASVHNSVDEVAPNRAKTAAYFRIFLDMSGATEKQRQWLDDFERKLSPDERQSANEIVRSYRPAPTEVTIKALSGQRAAQELVSSAT